MSNKSLHIAKYMRLSIEDDLAGESNSITSQRLLIDSYLQKMGWDTFPSAEFIDDGLTGTNFDRPGFQNLMKEIRKNKIDVVVIKDFSRLGRDYIEAGNLIEQVFPYLGIRLISVNDRYDSERLQNQAGDITVVLKNLANYFYSRDLSQKIRSANAALMKQGRYTASDTFYGYTKDPNQKGKLHVDLEAAAVIRQIYRWFFDGVPMRRIAVNLNSAGILPPAEYKAKCTGRMLAAWDARHGKQQYWTNEKVRNILKEERYTGTDIVGKRKVRTVGTHKMVPLPREEWIRIEYHHEAIISREEFNKAQKILLSIGKPFERGSRHPLSGKVICGVCGKSMTRAGQRNKVPVVYCETPHYLNTADCSTDRIPLIRIEQAVLNAIRSLFTCCFKENAVHRVLREIDAKIAKSKSMIRKENIKEQKLKTKIKSLYESWKEEKISEESFFLQKSAVEHTMQEIVERLASLQQQLVNLEVQREQSQNLSDCTQKYCQVTRLTGELVRIFIANILIYDKQHIEIVWGFELPLDA